jgi:predicted HTH domain antitoxin
VIKKEFLTTMAIQYFKEKRLSLGKAAELAGVTKNAFVSILSEHQIDIFQYSEKELQS